MVTSIVDTLLNTNGQILNNYILRERVGYKMINNQRSAELVMTIGSGAGGGGGVGFSRRK